ncbi:MAG TPA: hypothetical protein VHS06_01880 [Chloroflexota bacterium]|nr:hypothetical protein [Chloroflexota bacterium]
MDEVAAAIRQLYGDAVRVKVLPDKRHPENVFVGMCERKNFSDRAEWLCQKYGYDIDAGWVTIGQMNLPKDSTQVLEIPIGNPIDDQFEAAILSISNGIHALVKPRFPAIAFTPICIYRNC